MTYNERQSFNEQQTKILLRVDTGQGHMQKKGAGLITPAQTKHMNAVSKNTGQLGITSMI